MAKKKLHHHGHGYKSGAMAPLLILVYTHLEHVLPEDLLVLGPVPGEQCTVLYCIVLQCNVPYCTVLYCTVLYCTVLYCTVLYCTA